jgi:alkyl hydroperoxide reductase subunit AhpC
MLRIGDPAPNFTASTTDGDIEFYDWKKDQWAVLLSHPADFTPVCTTEIARVAELHHGFESRGVKVIALSVDSLETHRQWAPDIVMVNGTSLNFPIIADDKRTIASAYGMIHPAGERSFTIRAVFIIDPRNTIRAMISYPKSVGRNFAEILRVIDALQATDRDPVLTPADWMPGEPVVLARSVGTEEAASRFPHIEVVLPYLRFIPQPPMP